MSKTSRANGIIICQHIASGMTPILVLSRSESVDPQDTGWQALCGAGHDDTSGAEIWTIDQLLAFEPSLTGLLDGEIGTEIKRESTGHAWKISSSS